MTATSPFQPAPGAASPLRQVLAQAGMEVRLTLRNGEQLLVSIILPILALVGGVLGAGLVDLDLGGRPVDVLTPGVLALAVISVAFTSLSIATAYERRYNLIKRLGVSPLSRAGFLAGKVLAVLVVEVIQIVVIGGIALLLGWQPSGGVPGLAGAAVMMLLGTLAFTGIGLLLAGTVRAEATLAIANLAYLLMIGAGGVIIPLDVFGAFGDVLQWLPPGAFGEGMRGVLFGDGFPVVHAGVLALWGAVAAGITAKAFRWS